MEDDYEVLKNYFIDKEKDNLQFQEEFEFIKSKNESLLKSRNNLPNKIESASLNNLTTNCQENKLNLSEENFDVVHQISNLEPFPNPINVEVSPILANKKPNIFKIPNLKSTLFRKEKEREILESEKNIRSKSEISIRGDNTSPRVEIGLNMSGNYTENPIINLTNFGNTSISRVSI